MRKKNNNKFIYSNQFNWLYLSDILWAQKEKKTGIQKLRATTTITKIVNL